MLVRGALKEIHKQLGLEMEDSEMNHGPRGSFLETDNNTNATNVDAPRREYTGMLWKRTGAFGKYQML